jgi:hypothetical protein
MRPSPKVHGLYTVLCLFRTENCGFFCLFSRFFFTAPYSINERAGFQRLLDKCIQNRSTIMFVRNPVRSTGLIAENVLLPLNLTNVDLIGEKRRGHHLHNRRVKALSTVTNSVTNEDLDKIDDQLIAVVELATPIICLLRPWCIL